MVALAFLFASTALGLRLLILSLIIYRAHRGMLVEREDEPPWLE